MGIQSVLTHRASLLRSTEAMTSGSPTFTWNVVGVRLPCLFSREPSVFDPTWNASQRTEAEQRGVLFTLASADVQAGDRVTLTRPPAGDTFEVLPDPSTVLTLHTASHREHHVRQVP